jgi:hypothetical protein
MSPSGDSLVPGVSGRRQQKYRPLKKSTGRWPSVDLTRDAFVNPVAMASSLETIRAAPRTPRTPYSRSWDGTADGSDLELNLLAHEEHQTAANGSLSLEEDDVDAEDSRKKNMSSADKRAIALLIALCKSLHATIFLLCSRKCRPCARDSGA